MPSRKLPPEPKNEPKKAERKESPKLKAAERRAGMDKPPAPRRASQPLRKTKGQPPSFGQEFEQD